MMLYGYVSSQRIGVVTMETARAMSRKCGTCAVYSDNGFVGAFVNGTWEPGHV